MMITEPEIRSDYNFSLNEYFTDRGWVWQQYTGLKDKNGIEIYESDIVECDLYGEMVIIGNIYQNPELID